MTLAMHRKSPRRQGMLILAALFAVFGAVLAGATLRPASEAGASTNPYQNTVLLCKVYLPTGPIDDFGRTFEFQVHIDEYPFGNADYSIDVSITVDEGETACAQPVEIPAASMVGAEEKVPLGWDSAPGYPKYELVQFGQTTLFEEGTIFFFKNEDDCEGAVCVVYFYNQNNVGADAGYPIRVCKTHLDNGDAYLRPDTTFNFNANWETFSFTLAEGERECVIVYVPLEHPGQHITISEHQIANWSHAPGFMKSKIDLFPLEADPSMGSHAGAVNMRIDDGCYDPFSGVESLVAQAQVIETPDRFICTVYFFNMEEPLSEPECEVRCEPVCEVECDEPECDINCGEPVCEVNCDPQCTGACEPPVCLESCTEPVCQFVCEPPACQFFCEGSETPTPEATPEATPTAPAAEEPPSNPQPQGTPEPEEEIEGESTPGPVGTPQAPDTGSGATTTAADNRNLAATGLALLIAALFLGAAALPRRR